MGKLDGIPLTGPPLNTICLLYSGIIQYLIAQSVGLEESLLPSFLETHRLKLSDPNVQTGILSRLSVNPKALVTYISALSQANLSW